MYNRLRIIALHRQHGVTTTNPVGEGRIGVVGIVRAGTIGTIIAVIIAADGIIADKNARSVRYGTQLKNKGSGHYRRSLYCYLR